MKIKVNITGDSMSMRQIMGMESVPNKYLRLAIQSRNFSLVDYAEAELLIMFDHNQQGYEKFITGGGEERRAVLVRFESEAVRPDQYEQSVTRKYGLILSPGRLGPNGNDIPWPYEFNHNPSSPQQFLSIEEVLAKYNRDEYSYERWTARKFKLVMIAANKVSVSKNSAYSARRGIARSGKSTEFSLFGPMWQGEINNRVKNRIAVTFNAYRRKILPNLGEVWFGTFRNYPRALGEVRNKHEILSQSCFSIIVENSQTVMTEKLFDCLLNGVVPIYFGPSGLNQKIESSLIRIDSLDVEQILKQINALDSTFIEEKLKAGQDFIFSKYFIEKFSALNVYGQIFDECLLYFNTHVKTGDSPGNSKKS